MIWFKLFQDKRSLVRNSEIIATKEPSFFATSLSFGSYLAQSLVIHSKSSSLRPSFRLEDFEWISRTVSSSLVFGSTQWVIRREILENCLCLTLSWVISPSSWWHLFDHFNDHWDFRHSQPQGYRFWHYFTGCLGYQAVLPVSAPPGVIINRHSSFCVTWEFESFNFWSSSTHLSGPQGSRALYTHSNHIIICKNKPFLTSSSIICLMGFSQTNQNVWASKESSLRVRHSMIVIRYPFTFTPPPIGLFSMWE